MADQTLDRWEYCNACQTYGTPPHEAGSDECVDAQIERRISQADSQDGDT